MVQWLDNNINQYLALRMGTRNWRLWSLELEKRGKVSRRGSFSVAGAKHADKP